MIPFIDLEAQRAIVGPGVLRRIEQVLAHGAFIMGPEVAELEARLADYVGVAHAVTCSNGTDAIVLALRALGVGPGDAVLLPSFTFAASAGAVALVGAVPVFLDCLADTFNVDPATIEPGADTARAAGLRPAAVMPVDLFGQPADQDAVVDAATAAGLDVVVDGAQSFGATWRKERTGRFGRVTTTSFFPAKPLGCYGDGGALFTDDRELAALLRSLRVHGQGSHKYENVRVGTNARLDTIQAAVLLEKLDVFDDELERRQEVARGYAEGLAGMVTVPVVAPEARSAWAQYTIRLADRDGVAARLREAGIPTAIYYPTPLHRQPAFAAGLTAGTLDVSEELAATVLSIPMHPYLDTLTQERICDALRDAITA
jgi:dTDP-4-amino-4,6-dideoxygalactose transaminase